MPGHRFYLPPEACRDNTLSLTGREAHHALRVLRVQRGEQVVVLDGAGLECRCEVQDCGRNAVALKVVEKRSTVPLPCQLTLLQALPKGKLIESIIQKATELGVHRIVPLLAERVVAHIEDEAAEEKSEKWQLVAIEAIKQCGSAWLPRVEAPVTPQEYLARQENFDLALVGSLQPGSKHPREYFQRFQHEQGRRPGSVAVWIGPEGDFSPAELRMIEAAGALPITLGRLVLRTETAAIYCLSILNYELQAGEMAE
jgi:16S rRNA (uracil1498-N3)-methyltransferase